MEHNAAGQVSEDPVVREQMMERRARKLDTVLKTLPRDAMFTLHGDVGASLTLLCWGSAFGACLEAVQRLGAEGVPARLLQLRLLWPFPAATLAATLADAAPLVIAEHNHSGQLAQLLRAQSGIGCEHQLLKYSGRPMSGDEVFTALSAIAAGRGEKRMVLRNPYE